jgi:hypothetical protein
MGMQANVIPGKYTWSFRIWMSQPKHQKIRDEGNALDGRLSAASCQLVINVRQVAVHWSQCETCD